MKSMSHLYDTRETRRVESWGIVLEGVSDNYRSEFDTYFDDLTFFWNWVSETTGKCACIDTLWGLVLGIKRLSSNGPL